MPAEFSLTPTLTELGPGGRGYVGKSRIFCQWVHFVILDAWSVISMLTLVSKEQFTKEWDYINAWPSATVPPPKIAANYGWHSNVWHIGIVSKGY